MDFGFRTIRGDDGSVYMAQAFLGRLRLHVFQRGDADEDPHDHPWSFWTFPLTSYVEMVTVPTPDGAGYASYENVVRAFVPHHRPAEYLHRVLGRARPGAWTGLIWLNERGPLHRPGRIVTVVWRGAGGRAWSFLKHRDGRWCWQGWKEYVREGGRSAPCTPDDSGKA